LGYACVHQQGNSSERSSLAVPVRAGGDTLAALAVRFARNAVSQQVIRERFLPALRQAAHGIVGALHGSAVPAASSRSPSVTGFADTEA
jgi:DNA-binding IclR family transcriptional regulator